MKLALRELFKDLPGEELILQGLKDWEVGRATKESCLIGIARPILAECGVRVSEQSTEDNHEILLYTLLQAEPGDPYSSYNALLRQLVSFERALSGRVGRLTKA